MKNTFKWIIYKYKPRPCTILCVKFNGEKDIVQFIFTQSVAYSLEQKLSLHKKAEK